MVAGLSKCNGAPYVNSQNIKDAELLSLVWTETFPIGVYAPAAFPMLIALLGLLIHVT